MGKTTSTGLVLLMGLKEVGQEYSRWLGFILTVHIVKQSVAVSDAPH